MLTPDEQQRATRFQQLMHNAVRETGIDLVSGLWVTMPGGTKMHIATFELEDGTVVNGSLNLQPLEGWQPPPPTPNVEELLNEARAEIAELKAQVESLLNPEPVSLLDFIGPHEIMNNPPMETPPLTALVMDNGHAD